MLLSTARKLVIAGCTAGSMVTTAAFAQSSADAKAAATAPVDAAQLAAQNSPMQLAVNWRVRQGLYYKRNWGVEVIGVHPVSSGYMLAFRYRVLDPAKARPVNDLKGKAYLIDEASQTRLAVPVMENIGELRTGAEPQAERTYFMLFGNPGRLVKAGSRVSVVIGDFHIDNLIVN